MYNLENNDISFYIHLPFCNKKCHYCDFYTLKNNELLKRPYVKAVIREIKNISLNIKNKDKFNNKKTFVDTIYFGGGTPSLIKPLYLKAIILNIKNNFYFNKNVEITMESNPEGLDLKSCILLKKAGVNRVSIGLQSIFNDKLLKMGRTHDALCAEEAVNNLKKAGINNISLDFIIGLKGDNKSTIKSYVDFALKLDITHLSFYMLKVEEGTLFFKENYQNIMQNDNNLYKSYLFLCAYLKKHGFNQYEISNFAKSNFECKHNLKYWEMKEYIGIGPSACSLYNGKRYVYKKKFFDFVNFSFKNKVFDFNINNKSENILKKVENNLEKKEFLINDIFNYQLVEVSENVEFKDYFIFSIRLKKGICLEKLEQILFFEFLSKNESSNFKIYEKIFLDLFSKSEHQIIKYYINILLINKKGVYNKIKKDLEIKLNLLYKNCLIFKKNERIILTEKGFLISNSIINFILENN